MIAGNAIVWFLIYDSSIYIVKLPPPPLPGRNARDIDIRIFYTGRAIVFRAICRLFYNWRKKRRKKMFRCIKFPRRRQSGGISRWSLIYREEGSEVFLEMILVLSSSSVFGR
ncbi:hypothetical protein CEXT_779671 [Caerostris extrusa]|uniref:Uncharacterized protein n=1 Tax=Caerostris extrusa TaxID=172846 RepID=A0AAV4VRQ1_CAEEX|nr:hypothetical protein CEXT_779671 [Caerostris extrusa]